MTTMNDGLLLVGCSSGEVRGLMLCAGQCLPEAVAILHEDGLVRCDRDELLAAISQGYGVESFLTGATGDHDDR